MIVVIDADYNETEHSAHAAGVLAESILAEEAAGVVGAFVEGVGEYVPGQFFRREFKCVEAVMRKLEGQDIELIVVDGYADSGTGEKALGTFVFEEYGVPVIGIAKNKYKKCLVPNTEVNRKGCKKPLFVTSKGIDHGTAKEWIAKMHGEYRLPLLVKLADKAARDWTLGAV